MQAKIKASLLVPNREYDFRLIAENSAGKTESKNLTFIAPKVEEAPLAIGEPPSQTSGSAATLQGYINPGGLPTTYRFELGKSNAYGTDLPATEGTISGSKLGDRCGAGRRPRIE